MYGVRSGASAGRVLREPSGADEAGLLGARPGGPASVRPSRANAYLELALALSGAGLALFMVTHEALHLTVLFGVSVYDTLSRFMEDYYLLHAVVPPLVLLFLVHIYLIVRRVPTAYSEQATLLGHTRSMGHLDTWTWLVQVVTGIALFVLASIHVWVVLADLPIESAKSGARVFGVYLWSYIPFVVFVQMHIAVGLYRMVVKWLPLSRMWVRGIATAWMVAAISLGFAILVALYRLGDSV